MYFGLSQLEIVVWTSLMRNFRVKNRPFISPHLAMLFINLEILTWG